MGNIRLGIPPELAIQLRDKFNITTLIETGTYKAGTTIWAACNFKKVYSIEGFKPYYDKAVEKCAPHKNITLTFGDSREELPKILQKLKKPALIWLDAHWLGNVEDSAGTWGECPIIEELTALERCGVKHIILIDDEHCFKHELPGRAVVENWPDIHRLINRLKAEGYFVTTDEDVIIAVPPEAKELVEKYILGANIKIVVPTSNDYVNCLVPFAYLFNKFWSDKQPVTVMRYDVRPPKLPDNFYKPSIGKQADFSWSSGLMSFLKDFSSDYIMLMLEDYFLTDKVDTDEIKSLWEFMELHPEVAKIDLSFDRMNYDHSNYATIGKTQLITSGDETPWQTSIQAAIWRKDFLLRFLDPGENAWQFEKEGTKRVIAARESGEFTGFILGTKNPPLKYINAVGGHGTRPGEYDWRKFPGELLRELQGKRLA
ncbi:MAG: hypothetical protein WC998_01320 [Candidatus Paceibacterota bacterium]|jgi:hypothetical protein